MPITVKVKGNDGTIMDVNGERQIPVVVHPHPPKGEVDTGTPFVAYFTDSGGSSDMAVNGSSTNVAYCIRAEETRDVYIKTLSIIIADASQTLQEFGNTNAALTNGVLFRWSTSDKGTAVINDSLKTNFDFVRLAGGTPAPGNNYLVTNAIPTNIEAYIPVIDLESIFGLPYGIRLRRGTKDKLEFVVRDDCSAVDQFDILGYGFKF
jgi:hypothetical protein